MRNLTAILCLTLAILLGSAGESFALPECPGSPKTGFILDVRSWNNCQGTFTYADGTFADGNKYVGEWKDGKEQGQGTFTSTFGSKYVGEWNYGSYHGQGTYTFANGDKYVGEYKYGKARGKGTKTYANGDKYFGEWMDGEMHGQGTQTYANGRVQKGTWVKGKHKPKLKPKPWWKFW